MGIYGVLTFDGRSLLMDVINFRWLFSKYPPSRAFDALGIYIYIDTYIYIYTHIYIYLGVTNIHLPVAGVRGELTDPYMVSKPMNTW